MNRRLALVGSANVSPADLRRVSYKVRRYSSLADSSATFFCASTMSLLESFQAPKSPAAKALFASSSHFFMFFSDMTILSSQVSISLRSAERRSSKSVPAPRLLNISSILCPSCSARLPSSSNLLFPSSALALRSSMLRLTRNPSVLFSIFVLLSCGLRLSLDYSGCCSDAGGSSLFVGFVIFIPARETVNE